MKKHVYLTLFAFFFTFHLAFAQYSDAPNGITLRRTFINYEFPFSEKLDKDSYTGGVEIGYLRSLGKVLNLALPAKIGLARLPTGENTFGKAELVSGLDAILQLKYFKKENWLVPYLYGGVGGFYAFDQKDFNVEAPAGLGLSLRLGPHFYLNGQTEYRFGFDDFRDNLQHSLGFVMLLGKYNDAPKDSDGDGLSDLEDNCPLEAGPISTKGCPDKDNDGIIDAKDACPDQPGPAALFGCPDRDNDGITDTDDECPDEAGPKSTNGCPDTDGDGIVNKNDKCPNEAGTQSTNGCPDTDGDGIVNSEDLCPNQYGSAAFKGCPDTDGDGLADPDDRCPTVAGPLSNKGCPELKEEDKKTLAFAAQAIEFETGQAVLLPDSKKILDQVYKILVDYPAYKVRISGHTDSIGDAGANQSLSEKRARACYDYLVSKGIPASRMSHNGYGESQPIGDNRFKDGRKKNRRTEFNIYLD